MNGPAYYLTCESHGGTLLFAVTDDAGRVVGAAKLVPGPVWELESLAASTPARHTVAAALCHGIVSALRVNRARELAVTADASARQLLAATGLAPCGGSVAGLLDRQRRVNPEGYRLVTQGDGLDDVRLPYAGELLTAPADAGRELAPTG